MLLQIVLMFFFSVPEVRRRNNFGYNSSWPFSGSVHFTDQFLCRFLLLLAKIKNSGSVGSAHIISLPIFRSRIVDLEEKFQQLAVRKRFRVEINRDGFRMCAMITIGCVFYIPAGIANHS